MAGQFIDAPAPKFIDAPAPPESPIEKAKKVGGQVVSGLNRAGASVERGITAAARDPVGALGNTLGTLQRGVAGAVTGPLVQERPHEGFLDVVKHIGTGAADAIAHPNDTRYNDRLSDILWSGARPTGNDWRAKGVRTGQDFISQSITDPLQSKKVRGAIGAAASVIPKAAKMVPGVEQYGKDLHNLVAGPVKKGADAILPTVKKVTRPLRAVVDAGKDAMFLNSAVHGVGNIGTLNFLGEHGGLRTAARGLKYGLLGTPEKLKKGLAKAGADQHFDMGDSSVAGPIGLLERIPGKPLVKAAIGGAGGATAGYNTGDPNQTQYDRVIRALEGAGIGAAAGGIKPLRDLSNRQMTSLERGQRAALFENLDKKMPPQGPLKLKSAARLGKGGVAPRTKEIGDVINRDLGGYHDENIPSMLADSLGGGFARWQLGTVPKTMARAVAKNPQRVESVARLQDVVNKDALKDQPYKLSVGGPVGSGARLAFNSPAYITGATGLLGQQAKDEITNPQSLNPKEQLKQFLLTHYVPFGIGQGEVFKSKAPEAASMALENTLGWDLRNKAPSKEAILDIMTQTGLDQYKATQLYYRLRR